MGDSENGPSCFTLFIDLSGMNELRKLRVTGFIASHGSMRRRFVTLLQKLCIQG